MNIEELRKIRNKNVAQQNELSYLEMKQCMESLKVHPWVSSVSENYGQRTDGGILISLSDVPDQAGTLWYGSWLSVSKRFYNFEVLTNADSTKVIDVEAWQEVVFDISAKSKGTGKTHAYIALELLSEYTKS
jgi:hypothetical protein